MFNTSLAVRINDMANDLIYLRNPSGDQMSVELYDLFPPSTVDIRKVYINNLDASSAVLDIVMLTRVEPGHARN